MFKTSGRAMFQISSVLRLCSTFRRCFFSGTFIATPLPEKTIEYKNLLCAQRTFGNYWAFAVFRGPDLIANLSDGLKIIDPGFITCEEIGKLLFVIFWKHLKHLLATLARCLCCSSVNRCGIQLAEIFLTCKCFFYYV